MAEPPFGGPPALPPGRPRAGRLPPQGRPSKAGGPPATPPRRAARAAGRALPPGERGQVRALGAALGVDPGRLLATSRPSPGEARKLLVALGLGRHAWITVLDEPTNHLDLPSLERLEEALAGYPGALLLVTHDEAFARRLARVRWRIEGERLIVA